MVFHRKIYKTYSDGDHHIIEYKWLYLGLGLKLKDFSGYEEIPNIIRGTSRN